MRRSLLASLLLALLAPGRAPAADVTLKLPRDTTPVAEIGLYRMAYQSYGGDVVYLPDGWVGHFEPRSGVSYLPGQQVLGRDALLIHSPWRVPPGRAWAELHLQLPEERPIRFRFGIAMGPEFVVPDRSDGVTYSVRLTVDGTARELLRYHQVEAVWRDYDLDLSEYAGRLVQLDLQVEPGPRNNASWDYSYWGDPRLVVGQAGSSRAAAVAELLASSAVRATEGVSLERLANDSRAGIVPGNLLPCRTMVAADSEGYRFTYDAADAQVVYRWLPTTGTLDDLTVQVDGGRTLQPALGGGILGAKSQRASGGRALQRKLAGEQATVVWEYPDGQRATWTLGIVGKALTIDAATDAAWAEGYSLGQTGGAPLRRPLTVPYLAGHMAYLPVERLFTNRYLDWTVSNSSRCPQGDAVYEPKTDGQRNPLRESGFVTVSPCVNEVLPNLPGEPSPYLAKLGPLVMLDTWGHHKGTYAGDAEHLRDLKDNGVDHLAIIHHVWQRYGYDVKLPDHLPADPRFGGDEGMRAYGRAANECGYLWSLHENYIDLYPDAPSYNAADRVLRADGSPSPAWFNQGTGVQSFGLKCNRALRFAQQNAPEIHRRFATTAAYLDVHTCVPPWHQLDHEASQPFAAMARGKVKHDRELFQYMRDTHGGPLFGEGHWQYHWTGWVDGVEAQVDGGEDHAPFVDFDLLKLHPMMVNHGMGYYERWFRRGYNAVWGLDAGTPEQVDKYRAQEVAYGHAGFIGASQVTNVQWVAKEHHLMHAVQRLTGAAKVTDVRYEADGQLVPASVALALNARLRQRTTYTGGTTVYVNWGATPWTVAGRALPQWGFLVRGPNTEVTLCLRGDRFADWAECPEYVFADARTSFHMPYTGAQLDIEPRLKSFRHLGGNRVEVTYEWHVGETTDTDWHCFVHGTNERSKRRSDIEFQQDHALPRPASTWRVGETVVDGPHQLDLPAGFDTYDLVIGLHKGPRALLKGPDAGQHRVLLGRLRLKRAGEQVTNVTFVPGAEVLAGQAVPRADFTAHLNPAGTLVDFGAVATDGSVKVNRGAQALTVFPYPRGREFLVKLDLARLAGRAVDPGRAKVTAKAAGGGPDLAPVPASVEDGRLVFRVGLAGAGRYTVTW